MIINLALPSGESGFSPHTQAHNTHFSPQEKHINATLISLDATLGRDYEL